MTCTEPSAMLSLERCLSIEVDPLRRLEGQWHLHRKISDGSIFHGRAAWLRDGTDLLRYREEGTMRLAGGASFPCYRTYLYRQQPFGFSVFFDERPERLFHEVELLAGPDGALVGEAPHLCGRDLYETRYELGASLTITHRVTGPRKDYVMIGTYARQTVR